MRPLEYTQEIAEQAYSYIDQYEEYDHAIPSIAGLAQVINRARSTIYKWAEESDKQFSDILEKLMDKQQEVLLSKGLKGDFNSTITKLVLTKHGYSDSSNVKVEKSLSDYDEEELDRLIQERQRQAQQADE